jgi:hypothetical protein
VKKRFIPLPPRRRKGKLKKAKKSSYDYDRAREALDLPENANHLQVYSAAKASNEIIADNSEAIRNVTRLVISPSKDEVKAERDMFKRKLSTLESANESSKQTITSLHSNSLSLSLALKNEKIRSRTAMEELLLVTTRQTKELISTFQDRFRKLKTEHKADLRKLMRGSDQDRFDNQKYLERLRKTYEKKISELELDYRICFAEMEDKHQKKIVNIYSYSFILVDHDTLHRLISCFHCLLRSHRNSRRRMHA